MGRWPFILNLHGVGDAPRPYEPGERPYWLNRSELGRVLDLVQAKRDSTDIALTVDDGNSSDYEILAPELRKRGLPATFFVLAGKLDRPGYLQRWQVRDLAQAGFEIGSHGLQHVDWRTEDDASLRSELEESKRIIEAVTGQAVTAAAAPFGRYDSRVLRAAAKSGYRQVFSSDGGPRLTTAWPTPRQTLRSDLDVAALACQIGRWSLHHRARTECRVMVKSLLWTSTRRSG